MIKRHELYYTNDLGDDYPADSKDAEDGEWVAYADHAAFVERVREIAEGMVCAPDCDSRRPGHMVGGISFDVNSPPRAHEVKRKCNCPRGKLLALCEVR